MNIYPALASYDPHLLCAVDLETTGLRPGYNEIIQIAVLPLDSDIRPLKDVMPFYMDVAPEFPQRAEVKSRKVNGLDLKKLSKTAPNPSRVQDLFLEWFEKLNLPLRARIMPLAHNWGFEYSFLIHWLGQPLFSEIFDGRCRDSMSLAGSYLDRACFQHDELPYKSLSLTALCERFGVINHNPHDALGDCLATAELYGKLLRFNMV